MLRKVGEYSGMSVVSLRSSSSVALINDPIIQPSGLKIVGFYVVQTNLRQEKILHIDDVRKVRLDAVLIDDLEDLVDAEDLVRLKQVISLNYQLIDKRVYSESGKRLGKVVDFAIDETSWEIQKIYVGRSIIKDLSHSALMIDRSQIIEVSDTKVIVRDPTEKVRSAQLKPVTPQAN